MLIGAILFLSARDAVVLWLYSFLFGAGYGVLVPTIPVTLSRYFGAREFPEMFGVGQILSGLMGGLGPWVTAQISDATQSYTIPVYLIVGLLALSVVIAIVARPRTVKSTPIQPRGRR
jgi:cyanate permease